MQAVYLILIIFCIAMGYGFYDQHQQAKALQAFKDHSGGAVKTAITSTQRFVWSLVLSVGIAVVGIYTWIHPESVGEDDPLPYILCLFVMAITYFIYAWRERAFQDTTISRDSFYQDGKSYRFTSIGYFEPSWRSWKVHMLTGETLKVNPQKGEFLQQHQQELAEAKRAQNEERNKAPKRSRKRDKRQGSRH